ncbi:hypothetical protein [Streptomyces sp. NBC_01428]|uniref:hypothetical protein n=1 Tax=Streptomyces sp. NBC_01428 TaxID=2903861 RepID=UPI002E376C9C|nr:hypothetical protein [Streptomyces sp. NBC_01428]
MGKKRDKVALASENERVDLSGIGAIAAAAVAALGIPAALVVGRWQMRAAIDVVRATAVSDREQWRRSLRREAGVQFLVVTAEFERLDRDRLDADRTEANFKAVETAIKEIHRRATEAYYVLRIEAPDLSDQAMRLLDAAHWNASSEVRAARERQAKDALEQLESESHADMPNIRRMFEAYVRASLYPQFTQAEVQWRNGQMMAASYALNSGLRSLSRLTKVQVDSLMHGLHNPIDLLRREHALQVARDAFVAAIHSELNAS